MAEKVKALEKHLEIVSQINLNANKDGGARQMEEHGEKCSKYPSNSQDL